MSNQNLFSQPAAAAVNEEFILPDYEIPGKNLPDTSFIKEEPSDDVMNFEFVYNDTRFIKQEPLEVVNLESFRGETIQSSFIKEELTEEYLNGETIKSSFIVEEPVTFHYSPEEISQLFLNNLMCETNGYETSITNESSRKYHTLNSIQNVETTEPKKSRRKQLLQARDVELGENSEMNQLMISTYRQLSTDRKVYGTRNGYGKKQLTEICAKVKNGDLDYSETSNVSRNFLVNNTKEPKTTGRRPVFSKEEECAFVNHILSLNEVGLRLKFIDLRFIVKDYLDNLGRVVDRFKDNIPGKDWCKCFMNRHKRILSGKLGINKKKGC